MTQPDHPAPIDPADETWPDQDDPEATRVVRRDPLDGDEASATQRVSEPPSDGFMAPADAPADSPSDPMAGGEPTTAVPPYDPSGQAPTSYIGAPTAAYPGPGSTGPQAYTGPPSGGYSYQQPSGYQQDAMASGPLPAGPQFVPAPPATASVTLPPVRMPKAESRVAMNVLGSIVGLILLAGGLTLIMLFQGKIRQVDTTNPGDLTGSGAASFAGSIDVLSLVLVIVGAILIALVALLTAWASWAGILPGVLLTAASVWAMITTGANSGGRYIADGTKWAFSDGQLAFFCMSGMGLLTGLLLLLAGLAAVFLRAGVRRTIRQQLESIQA